MGPYAGYQQPTTGGPPGPQRPTMPGYPPPPPAPGRDIKSYAPPRTSTSTIVIVVGVLSLIGVLMAAVFLRSPAAAPAPAPTAPIATTALPGQPFSMPRDPSSSGRWEVVGRSWDASGVNVHIRVTADTGVVTYGFQAFGKGSADATMPTPGSRQPALDRGILDAGEVADGWIFLELPQAESTLFLTTRDGRAISALPIKP